LYSAFLDSRTDLHLNPSKGKNVYVGYQNPLATSLYVTGDVYVGRPPNQFQLISPIDVQIGLHTPSTPIDGNFLISPFFDVIPVSSTALGSSSNAALFITPAAVVTPDGGGSWSFSVYPPSQQGNEWQFPVYWIVSAGVQINSISYLAVFYS
jgi:hypothetical protein